LTPLLLHEALWECIAGSAVVGVAATRKTVSVATGPSEGTVTTSENYDRQGRLISLEDARGTTS